MTSTKRTTRNNLENILLAARNHAAQLEADARKEVRKLDQAIRLARGTADVSTQAANAQKGPHWIGDETDTPTLIAAVERAITERPLTLAQLSETTGARRNRLSGALVKLQLAGKPVRNLGDGLRAIWSIGGSARHGRARVR